CAFLTFSTATVKRYPAGAAPLSSAAKTLRYTASAPVVARRGLAPSRPGPLGRHGPPTNRMRPRSAATTGPAPEGTSHNALGPPVRLRLGSHSNVSSVIGKSQTRVPVAWKTALATCAATPTTPGSPSPLAPSGLTWARQRAALLTAT